MIDLTQYRRRATHEVRIGACTIGGTHPVAVQSMTNTDTRDIAACVAQIERYTISMSAPVTGTSFSEFLMTRVTCLSP